LGKISCGFDINFQYLNYFVMATYYGIYIYLINKISLLRHNYATRNGLWICLTIRFVPSILLYLNLITANMRIFTVISDGAILTVVTSEIIVSKMAQRELHPLIPVFIMISLFDNFICVTLSILYYGIILTE